MSFKSMESVMNLFSNKPLKNRYSKESVIYSTELVNDMRKLVKYDAFSKEFDDQLARISEEIDMTVHSIESYFDSMERKYLIGKSIQKEFSKEMFDFYARSLEKIDIKEVGKGILKTVEAAFKRFWAWLVGMIKKIVAFGTKIWIGQYKKTYESFKAENFTNMDAKIKVHKLNDNLNTNEFTFGNYIKTQFDAVENKTNNSNADRVETNDKLIAEINEKYFGTKEKPETVETTVGSYLKAKSGQKPNKIELLGKVDNIKKAESEMQNLLKLSKSQYQKMVASTKKQNKGTDEGAKQDFMQYKIAAQNISYLQRAVTHEFMCMATVLGDINKAVKAGLSKAKTEKK